MYTGKITHYQSPDEDYEGEEDDHIVGYLVGRPGFDLPFNILLLVHSNNN